MNKQSSVEFLERLPFLFGVVKESEYKFLLYKWGGMDGSWHSIKNAIKSQQELLGLSFEQARKIELEAIKKIDEITIKIFTCGHCSEDLRKCGIKMWQTGVEISDVFMTQDGTIGRNNHQQFETRTFKEIPRSEYFCLKCNRQVAYSEPAYLFIKKGMNLKTVRKYMKDFKSVDVIPVTKEEENMLGYTHEERVVSYQDALRAYSTNRWQVPQFDEFNSELD